jgi:RNA polymerase sigma-70 factor (family 1)
MKRPPLHSEPEVDLQTAASFTKPYTSLQPALYLFAKSFVNDKEEARDIIAESFIKLWRMRDRFDKIQNIKAFLFVTTKNACLDSIKASQLHSAKHKELLTRLETNGEAYYVDNITKAEVLKAIHEAIQTLPDKCRTVFTLSYVEGLKNDEIAIQLRINIQSVKNYKNRAVNHLRTLLENKPDLIAAFPIYISLQILVD